MRKSGKFSAPFLASFVRVDAIGTKIGDVSEHLTPINAFNARGGCVNYYTKSPCFTE